MTKLLNQWIQSRSSSSSKEIIHQKGWDGDRRIIVNNLN